MREEPTNHSLETDHFLIWISICLLAGLIVAMPTILGQIGVGIPVTLLSLMIRMLELFVSFLQAYIFTFLATLFIASAVAPEH